MTQSALAYSGGNSSTSTASTTWYAPFNSEQVLRQVETTEAAAQAIWRGGAATLRNMRVKCSTNGRAQSTSWTSRINTAAGTLSVATGGSGAGTFTDLTHTDSLADGDLWNYAMTTGSSTGTVNASVTAEIQTSGQVSAPIAGWGSTAFSSARFWTPGGGIFSAHATETPSLAVALETTTVSNLQLYLRANASTGFTWKTRKNGADGALTVSPGSGATGWFEDTTHSDSLAASDTWGYTNTLPSASATVGYTGVKYASSTAGACAIHCQAQGNPTTAGTTTYMAPGSGNPSTTEAANQLVLPFATTLSKLSARVTANASSTDFTVQVRKSTPPGATGNGNNVVVIPTGTTTGVIQDTTHTDTFAVGDTVNLILSGATTGSVTLSWLGMLMTQVQTSSSARPLTLLGVG